MLSLIWGVLSVLPLQAQTEERYIEITGTSEIEIVSDKIHYIIEIREYFEEEFDGKSKQRFDITLIDFKLIDEIIGNIDTRGINTMRVGELENKDMLVYPSERED